MPKSITLGWKEYQELLNSLAEADDNARMTQEQLEEARRQLARFERDVPLSQTYQKLYRAYTELRDRQLNVTMDDERARSRQMAAESEARARQAEAKANALTEQLDTVTAKVESLTARNEAQTELLKQARTVADELARSRRPHGALPVWMSVADVLKRKEREAAEGRTWTVQGYTDED